MNILLNPNERAEVEKWMYEHLEKAAVSETLYQKLVHPEKFGVMEDGTTVRA